MNQYILEIAWLAPIYNSWYSPVVLIPALYEVALMSFPASAVRWLLLFSLSLN
jgi:hypothetical protein